MVIIYNFYLRPMTMDWLLMTHDQPECIWKILSVYAFMYFYLSGERIDKISPAFKRVHDSPKAKEQLL